MGTNVIVSDHTIMKASCILTLNHFESHFYLELIDQPVFQEMLKYIINQCILSIVSLI